MLRWRSSLIAVFALKLLKLRALIGTLDWLYYTMLRRYFGGWFPLGKTEYLAGLAGHIQNVLRLDSRGRLPYKASRATTHPANI